MKKIFIGLTAFCLFAAWYFLAQGKPVTVDIPEGKTAFQVAQILKQEGVIRSALWFKVVLKLTGTGKKIKPGEYKMRRNTSAEAALLQLVRGGGKNYVKIVIPEGWRVEQIAERLEAQEITGQKPFLEIAKKNKFEGYLFPTTYFLERGMEAGKVISMMRAEFEKTIRPVFKDKPPYLSENQAMVIASIVEREAVVTTEKPLIAAVYLNRMRRGMALEADPTVQYALGYWKKGITLKDLKIKSPYNTYRNSTLPPGPICNPGYDAVHAVMHPAKIDSLYFVADRKGQHIFNVTFKQHIQARRMVEKIKQ